MVYERAADEGLLTHHGPAAPDGHVVHDDGVLRITWTSSRPTLALAGEIDAATYPGLLAALAVTAAQPGEIHLDLAGLEYCDLAGLRAMVQLTGAGQADGDGAGHRVVLHGTPAWLATVLRIVGWDATPGLILDESTGVRLGDRGC